MNICELPDSITLPAVCAFSMIGSFAEPLFFGLKLIFTSVYAPSFQIMISPAFTLSNAVFNSLTLLTAYSAAFDFIVKAAIFKIIKKITNFSFMFYFNKVPFDTKSTNKFSECFCSLLYLPTDFYFTCVLKKAIIFSYISFETVA